MFPQAPGALSAAQAPQASLYNAAPVAPQAPPGALPYNYFPAPRIGPAAAGSPARPVSPMIQSTGLQIGDALSAARAPQQPAQQPAQQPVQQQLPQPFQQQVPPLRPPPLQLRPDQLPQYQHQGPAPQQFQPPVFGGGFDWRGQQAAPGRSPEANVGAPWQNRAIFQQAPSAFTPPAPPPQEPVEWGAPPPPQNFGTPDYSYRPIMGGGMGGWR